MLATKPRAATVLFLVLATGLWLGTLDRRLLAQPPQGAETPAKPAQPDPKFPGCPQTKPPCHDAHGDPLPEGAVSRLGTVRLRHGHIISGLVFSGDGKSIFASDFYSGVHVWDASEGKEVGRFFENDPYCQGVALSPDGRTLAVAIGDLTVRLCDPVSGREFGLLPSDNNRISSLVFSPDGSLMAA